MSRSEEGGRAEGNSAPVIDSKGMGRFDELKHTQEPGRGAPSFDPIPSELEPFRETRYELIRLHSHRDLDPNGRSIGKQPLSGWRTEHVLSVDEAQTRLCGCQNVGVRLRACDLVVDVDPRNFAPEDDPLKRIEEDLGICFDDFPHVITGSGGSHFYMTLPKGFQSVESLKAYQGVEFKTFGRQMVSPGSIHPSTGQPYIWDPLSVSLTSNIEAPKELLDLIRKPITKDNAEPGELTAEQLALALEGLDPVSYSEHDRWLELMMACHHATAGDGREEFANWSAKDPEYSDHGQIVRQRWDSLSTNRSGRQVTVKTLFKALHDAKRSDLIPRNKAKDDFPDDLVGEGGLEPRSGIEDEWVYVIDAEVFVRRSDGKKWSKEQWKAAHADCYDGEIVNAVFKGKLRVRKFESLTYLPCSSEFPDGEEGIRYNIWRDSSIKPIAGDVSVFLDHMSNLIPDEQERSFALDYLAMIVQNPARKVNYALLVRGAQGTGKSWIGRIMTAIIGSRNVVFPSNDEVLSKWTIWTEGSSLAVIEELMARGRIDMAARLKPIITGPTLRIEEKQRSIYTIPNHLNLIAFTNHEDALPIEAGDRRWLVISSEMEPKDEAYYDRLFAFLDGDGPSAVKHYLLARRVQLKPKGMAPNTKGKAEMRRRTLSEAEQYLGYMFEAHEGPFAFDLVRLDDLVECVPVELKRRTRNIRAKVADWLKVEVGAYKHTRYTKSTGDRRLSCQLWSIRNHDKWREAGAAARADAFMHRYDEEATVE